jgi:hypothetical protein
MESGASQRVHGIDVARHGGFERACAFPGFAGASGHGGMCSAVMTAIQQALEGLDIP